MKKTVLRYGGFSALLMVIFFLFSILTFKDDFNTREILGWVGIFLSTTFIFFGIKYYRDHYNNGNIGFGKGLQLGLLILLAPSIAFGLFSLLYIELNPDFMDNYYNHKVSEIRASLPASEANLEIQAMEKEKDMFMSPAVQFFAMFFSVFAVGLIVTVISALVLRRSGRRVQA